ncbi:unnamed protein product [Sphagnum troendelagicum]
MTHLQSSLWKRLAQVDFEENKFLQALSSYAKALRSALRSMESDLLQELADFVAVELQVKQAAWIDKYLTDLMVIHQDSGAYGKAAEVSHTLKIWESRRAIGKAIRCSSLVVEKQLWQGRKQGISVPKKIHMSMMTRKL